MFTKPLGRQAMPPVSGGRRRDSSGPATTAAWSLVAAGAAACASARTGVSHLIRVGIRARASLRLRPSLAPSPSPVAPYCSRSSTSNSSLRSSALRWPTPRNEAGVLLFRLGVAALRGAERKPDGFCWSSDVLHPASAANQLQSVKRTASETVWHRWQRRQRAKQATAAPSQPWRTSCGVSDQVPFRPVLQSPWSLVSAQ